jgi:vancomycin resistance protein YoaR
MTTAYTRRSARSSSKIALVILFAFFITLFLLILILGVTAAFSSSGKISPGTYVNGVDLSGQTIEQAATSLAIALPFPSTGQILLQYGDRHWLARPAELGLILDVNSTALNAYTDSHRGGLPGSLWRMLRGKQYRLDVPAVVVLDESLAQRYLVALAAQINRPTIEAGIHLSGLDVITTPGQVGLELDINATLPMLSAQLQTLTDGVVSITVVEHPPLLKDAAPLANAARSILSAPLTLTLPDPAEGDPGPWEVDANWLASTLTIAADPTHPDYPYKLTVQRSALRGYLEQVAPELERYPENARFIFNDDTLRLDLLQPSTSGRSLDMENSLDDILLALQSGNHTVPLRVVITQPAVDDTATGADLGITQLVHKETTYFYGSTAARIHNIRTAAENFHGLLIAPGEEFSMANAMKDVSLDNGYTEALIIFGNQTIKGVGGGVCQVSTTLFRAAFFSGFPVTERYAHAYRVGYYEQTSSGARNTDLAGLDATVFIPVVDFKFVNDTPYWLLMETYVSDSWITWKFYSTADGRVVEWQNHGLENVVEAPKPLYKENGSLAQGKIKQIDYEADGADVRVSRTVYRNGQIYFQDVFDTHYEPWQAIYEYGPGTDLPPGALTE